ncbi:hypothetical protein [uncultured Anaerococcus sp.]|uniref:hypothetical protein n=1 Tax=uncultured Anaerococcus sp. TaxID=293428 RepID=UPI0026140A13|nr:hypothetical protein [uncultured Anaerococcus sp.]
MNKKVLSAGLCLSLVLGAYTSADASEDNVSKEDSIKTDTNKEVHNYLFEVSEVTDKDVKLVYNGESINDSIQTDLDESKSLIFDKSMFDEGVNPKDIYQINSSKDLKNLTNDDVKEEDIKLVTKYEKPENMDENELPEDAQKDTFEVKNLGDKDSNTATVFQVGNPNNLFTIDFDQLRDDNPEIGDQYEIYWDGIIMESNPAQFGKIYRVDKKEGTKENGNNNQEMDETLEFEVTEINDGIATLAEVDNKDNLYTISFEELKDKNPEIGDKYKIHWNGISMKSYPAQFGEIYDIEKINTEAETNKDDLKKAIDDADKINLDEKSYKSEDIDVFKQAYDEAVKVYKDPSASQEAIDNSKKNLIKSMDALKLDDSEDTNLSTSEVEKDNKSDTQTKKANSSTDGVKKEKLGVGNPKTGIGSAAPLLGVIAIAGAILKKSKI